MTLTLKFTSSEFLNSNGQCIVVGEHKFTHHENYFLGNDSSKWKSNVPSFKKIIYNEIYPGIDLTYYEKFGHLKHDLLFNLNTTQRTSKYNTMD